MKSDFWKEVKNMWTNSIRTDYEAKLDLESKKMYDDISSNRMKSYCLNPLDEEVEDDDL